MAEDIGFEPMHRLRSDALAGRCFNHSANLPKNRLQLISEGITPKSYLQSFKSIVKNNENELLLLQPLYNIVSKYHLNFRAISKTWSRTKNTRVFAVDISYRIWTSE